MSNIADPNSTNANKLRKRITREVGKAIADYNMINEGDHILVCCSGGKDSYAMLSVLMDLQRRAKVNFRLTAMNLDQKQPGFPEHILPEYFEKVGVDFKIVNADTYSIVKEKIPEGKTFCSLCSRLRRGIIYNTAKDLSCNKVALGHHKDDIVETLHLNMMFGGYLKAMPPKLLTQDKAHILIRPMSYCREKDLEKFARYMEYPIIPCNLCGTQDNMQRQEIKKMLAGWEAKFPGRVDAIFHAIQNIRPSQLADHEMFDFKGLEASTQPEGATEVATTTAGAPDLWESFVESKQLFANL